MSRHVFSAWAGFMLGLLSMAALALLVWQAVESDDGEIELAAEE